MQRPIKPTIEVTDDSLIITLPLSQMKAYVESDQYSAVEITDEKAFAVYLARYLQNPKRRDEDVTELLGDNIRAVFGDAIYVGAGIRSRLEDIPHLVDRLWRDHEKILTIYKNIPSGTMTPHGCLIEAIRAARNGDFESAAEWLDRGQDLNEEMGKILRENVEEAMDYAIATYGSKSNGAANAD
jgi:hypothetical protein